MPRSPRLYAALPPWCALVLTACGPGAMLGPDASANEPDAPSLDAQDAPLDASPPPTDTSPGEAGAADARSSRDGGDAAAPLGDASSATDAAPLAARTERRNTGTSGEIDVTVPIDGHRSFMLVANAANAARVSVLSVQDPRGATVFRWQDWYNGPRNLTNAVFASRTGTAFNWPVRAADPALVPGNYTVRVGTYRVDGTTPRPDIDLDVTTLTRRDADPAAGRVRVVVVWANGLERNAALVSATEAAVAHWRTVWTAAGMDFSVRYRASTLPTALPYPGATTGELFLQVSSLVEDGEIPVVLGETVDNSASQYGAAGHLPGPVVASPLRAIVVGWLANAGGDGAFSAADITLYGEVLAHEVGHYVGLFHPVERMYNAWDALDDTPECRNERTCEDMLGTNLMFPYSICDMGTCVSTMALTPQQRGVMHRYTGAE